MAKGPPPAAFDEAFLGQLERLHLVSKKVFAGQTQAMRRSRRLGAGIDVADFRPYAAGDDLRHVDWNYYASARELLLRLFEEEEDLHIHLLLDTSGSMRTGDGRKADYARRVVAALGWIGLANLDRVAVVPFADRAMARLPASRGRSQVWKLLRFVASPPEGVRTDLRESFRTFLAQTARKRGLVVVVSDLEDERSWQDAVDQLRYHRMEPLLIHVHDLRDLEPALNGDVELEDCETGERLLVTVTPELLRAYRAEALARLDAAETWCRSRGVLYFRAPVQLPFDELVLQIFRKGGFVR